MGLSSNYMAKDTMGMAKMNLRDWEISPGDAVDVTETKMLSGLASDTISYTEDNDTKEYTTGKAVYGELGATGRS